MTINAGFGGKGAGAGSGHADTSRVCPRGPGGAHSAGTSPWSSVRLQYNTLLDNNGIVTFTDKFPYLGTVINSALTDDDDVRHRKQCATAAFGQLKQNMFCSEYASESLSRAQKGKLFKTFVLGTLLFGCELWCHTTSLRQELCKFYNNCVRSMCNVTRRYIAHTTHGKLDSLYDALGVQSLYYDLLNRRLGWTCRSNAAGTH